MEQSTHAMNCHNNQRSLSLRMEVENDQVFYVVLTHGKLLFRTETQREAQEFYARCVADPSFTSTGRKTRTWFGCCTICGFVT